MSTLSTKLYLENAIVEVTRETVGSRTGFRVYLLNKSIQEHVSVFLNPAELCEMRDLVKLMIDNGI